MKYLKAGKTWINLAISLTPKQRSTMNNPNPKKGNAQKEGARVYDTAGTINQDALCMSGL